ncbi:TPA: porin family protein [Legionella pneumophila]|nr:porin family protein [Legionella pneumophila]
MKRNILYRSKNQSVSQKSIYLLIVSILSANAIAAVDASKTVTANNQFLEKEGHQEIINWTGFYIGPNGGGIWGNPDTNILPLPTPTQFLINAATLTPSLSGGLFGGQIGYNRQMSVYRWLVLGIETDMNWSDLSGNTSQDAIGNGRLTGRVYKNAFSTHQRTKWFGTLRPRIGFLAREYLLMYGTGGLAYGRVNENANSDYRPIGTQQYLAANNATLTGWTAGGGAELAFSQHWSAKVEYLYYDLGSTSTTANPFITNPPFQTQYTWDNTAQLVRFGVNLHC